VIVSPRAFNKPAPRKTSMLDRLHLGPMITPNGAGIGLSWENE